ncbi:hypothetical protein V3C99_002376 [Haemonchus contortus]|uniref:Secreted protein n=1 Tax=Haemonchus contortus TaxID=6289 RepID=A0A7I4YC86_HAECO
MRRDALCGAVALVPSMPGNRIRLDGRPGQLSRPPPPLWLIALALVQYGGIVEVAAQKQERHRPESPNHQPSLFVTTRSHHRNPPYHPSLPAAQP